MILNHKSHIPKLIINLKKNNNLLQDPMQKRNTSSDTQPKPKHDETARGMKQAQAMQAATP